MEFKDKLKMLRREKGVSQQKLADEIFVSRSAVAKWENGLGYPNEDSVVALAEYFCVEKSFFKTEETENVIVNKNRHIKLLRQIIAAVFGVVVFAGIWFFVKWFSTAYETDISALEKQAARYLEYEELEIMKTERRGNFLAALCTDNENNLSLCVFDRSDTFKNRWYASGGKRIFERGDIVSWNYGSPKDGTVLVFCGSQLSEEIKWYTFMNDGIQYTCPVENGVVLDIFIILDSNNINGYPIELNNEKQPIK